jgi:hypothetical protein
VTDLAHEIRIQVDALGQPLGATLVVGWGSQREQIQPVAVGPFETLVEVAERLAGMVDTQLTLW